MTRFTNPIAAALFALTPMTALAQDNVHWQGAYAGIMSTQTTQDFSVAPGLFDDINHSTFELYGGYNHALGSNWVVGAEATLATGPTTSPETAWPYGFDNEASLRLRAGYATGDFLIYGGAGYTRADMTLLAGGSIDTAEGVSYFIGGEMMVTETISARIEYGQTELDGDFFGPNQSETLDQISVGAAYHF